MKKQNETKQFPVIIHNFFFNQSFNQDTRSSRGKKFANIKQLVKIQQKVVLNGIPCQTIGLNKNSRLHLQAVQKAKISTECAHLVKGKQGLRKKMKIYRILACRRTGNTSHLHSDQFLCLKEHLHFLSVYEKYEQILKYKDIN